MMLAFPQMAWAQRDMIGFDLLAFLAVLPALVWAALGEMLLVLAGAAVLMLVLGWLDAKFRAAAAGGDRAVSGGRRLSHAAVAAVIAAAVALALLYERWSGPAHQPPARKAAVLQAPNGKAWPKTTDYLDLPQAANAGGGTIRVSHRSGAGRAWVKLCEAGRPVCAGLRHAIVQRNGEFEFGGLAAGTYEIRYILIDRSHIAGRSRPVAVSGDPGAIPVVKLPAEPSLHSMEAVAGIDAAAF
jgi:hypothetical protein